MKSYTSYDDGTLVQLLSRSDQAAFEELYNRYWQRMVGLAYVKLQSSVHAKDVVQELFFELWKRRANLDVKNFENYISVSVKYKIIALLAKEYRQEKSVRAAEPKREDRTTEEVLRYADLKVQIEKTVSALPEKCQLVFRLSREAGLTVNEISGRLNISPKTTEAHLTKAIKTLRSKLDLFVCFI